MSNVRDQLIKIAYENPELRAGLLPVILKEAKLPGWVAPALAVAVGVGGAIHGISNRAPANQPAATAPAREYSLDEKVVLILDVIKQQESPGGTKVFDHPELFKSAVYGAYLSKIDDLVNAKFPKDRHGELKELSSKELSAALAKFKSETPDFSGVGSILESGEHQGMINTYFEKLQKSGILPAPGEHLRDLKDIVIVRHGGKYEETPGKEHLFKIFEKRAPETIEQAVNRFEGLEGPLD